MPKYILKKLRDENNRFDTTNVTIEIDTESLPDLIEGMEDFIKACSFSPVTLEYSHVNNTENEDLEDVFEEK